MRFFFIVLFLLSTNLLAAPSSTDVVNEYIGFIENPKIEKIDQIFSEKFTKELGGKEKIIELYKSFDKKKRNYQVKKISELDDTDYIQISSDKHKSTFILKKDKGTYKIDGTIESE